jgi:hypothetical protein
LRLVQTPTANLDLLADDVAGFAARRRARHLFGGVAALRAISCPF